MYLKEMMALLSIKGLGMQTLKKLVSHYDGMEELAKAIYDNRLFKETNIKGTESIRALVASYDEDHYRMCLKKEQVEVISYLEEDYPTYLRQIDTFPLMLHYKGTIDALNHMPAGVAVVGSRKISSYGQRVAYDIGRFLSQYKIPVVSGLAYGVDYEVHRGVLKGRGFPVGVVANGLEQIYPRSHEKMSEAIVKSGVLLTEEFLYSSIEAFKFPIRNRIISGLSKVIVVVEAEEKSGSLITAQHGLDQGKVVFAVPGSIYSSTSKGTNRLISEGAIPLMDFEQIIEEYDSLEEGCHSRDEPEGSFTEIEGLIIKELKKGYCLTVEELAFVLNCPHKEILLKTMSLEIKGHIRAITGNKYQLL